MEDTEVNYENVRNIPIKLFDGTLVEKKRVQVETKSFQSTIKKEKKEIIDDVNNNSDEKERAKTDEKDKTSLQNIPIKINFINSNRTRPGIKSNQIPVQNKSLSSSIPSLAEVSGRSTDHQTQTGHHSSQGGQKTLDNIQNDLEIAQQKLAKHRQQIEVTSGTYSSCQNRNNESRSRSVETASRKKDLTKNGGLVNKREESFDLEKYMEVWRNISRDLDEIIKNVNVDLSSSEVTRNSAALRARSVAPNNRSKTLPRKNGKEEEAKPEENIYLTEVPPLPPHKQIHKSTESLGNKQLGYKGAKGLQKMLKEREQKNVETEVTIDDKTPKPPKRDIRSNFFGEESGINDAVINGSDNNKADDRGELVPLPTDAACYACDACTQTGDGDDKDIEKEKGCNVM